MPIPMTTTHLKIYYDKMLGKGSFSKVFPGRYKDNIVAVKIITTQHLEKIITIQLKRELQVIRILQEHPHKNIATYYKICQSNDKMIIVMELCSGGELTKYIKRGLDLDTVKNYFLQILDGYDHLLELNIMHRDIKSANILISQEKKTIKIIDFGLSKVVSVDLNQTICGSPLYMAPEVLDHRSYNTKSDIWSIGVLLYEMIYGFTPFNQCTVIKTLKHTIKNNAIVYYPMSTQNLYVVTPDMISYMKKLLEMDPQKRIDWNKLRDAQWLTDINTSISTMNCNHNKNNNDTVLSLKTNKLVFNKNNEIVTTQSTNIHQNHLLPKSKSLYDNLSISQVEEIIQQDRAIGVGTPIEANSIGFNTVPYKYKQEIFNKDNYTKHNVIKQPVVSLLTRELLQYNNTKDAKDIHDKSNTIGLSTICCNNTLNGQINPFNDDNDEILDSDINVKMIYKNHLSSQNKYNKKMDNQYEMNLSTSYGTEYIPRITPSGNKLNVRGESFGDVVNIELKINELSFIGNNFSKEYTPLIEQQKKLATESGLIDIDDVSDLLITNIPGKTTMYEYFNTGTNNISSFLYSKSAPIATTVIHGLGKVARSTLGVVGNIATKMSPKY